MPTLTVWLMSMVASMAARVFTSLGIGFLSFTALNTLVSAVASAVTSNFTGGPSVAVNLLELAGFGTALGVILAAMTTRAAIMALKRIGPVS